MYKRTKIKEYFKKVYIFLLEYPFIVVPWQVVQKLFVKKSVYPLVYLSRIEGIKILYCGGLIIIYAS